MDSQHRILEFTTKTCELLVRFGIDISAKLGQYPAQIGGVMGLKFRAKSTGRGFYKNSSYSMMGWFILIGIILFDTRALSTPLSTSSAALSKMNSRLQNPPSLIKNSRHDQTLAYMDSDADCRFFVDGLGKVRTKILDGRYSILAMRAELVVNIPRANVIRVGQWSRWVDARVTETSSLAYPPRLSEEHGFDPQNGRYIIQTPFSWGQQSCPGCVNNDEFSGQISELCWWIDIINEHGEEERIWYSDYGRNFHLDELFSWPTYAAGTTDKIILWLDQNAPVFTASRQCKSK